MDSTSLFWTFLAAILFGNLLTAAFIWAIVSYSKEELRGRDGKWTHLLVMLMVIGFLVAGMHTVFTHP